MLSSLNYEEDDICDAKKRRLRQLVNEKILFVKCENFVRLCRSSSTKWFLKDLQSNCPFELTIIKEIPGGIKLLGEIEKSFEHYRHQGQWFRYEGALKNWIEDTQ
jgi:hypothetical protein